MTTGTMEKATQLILELEQKTKVEEAPEPLFDVARDNRLITQDSHFFCLGCLVARPGESQSYDPRYCQNCYDFLLKEADMVSAHQKATWHPKTPDRASCGVPKLPVGEYQQGGNNKVMAHINMGNGGRFRGRPSLVLPVERIKALAGQGMKAAEILQQLRGEGVSVSRRTVYRVLSKKSSQH